MDKESLIKKELESTTGYSHYNGWDNNRCPYGYHSYTMDNIDIKGQRDTLKRAELFREHVDFKDKTVVDFGCNVGAVMHHLHEIKSGTGLDFDEKCVDAGNRISVLLGKGNIQLIQCDLDKEPIASIAQKVPEKADVVLLLSIGSWVKNWKAIYDLAVKRSETFIVELNNKEEGDAQVIFLKELGCQLHKVANQSMDDLTGNHKRILYIGSYKPGSN